MSLLGANDKIKSLLAAVGYDSLYPPQQMALQAGIMEGKNILVTTPTASGKTLIAVMAALAAIERGQKVVYMTPLRALASEKYDDLQILERLSSERKVRVMLSTSDYDSSGENLGSADVVVLTNEKMDALFRHGASWLGDVGLFISDEVHLIGDRDRGPTLEIILTRIRKSYPSAQLLALSATVANSDEIASWLGCSLLENNWRPTKLVEGVFDYGSVRTNDRGRVIRISRTNRPSAVDVALDAISDGGQSLIFAETRKRAASLAAKAAEAVDSMLDSQTKEKAEKISREILASGEGEEITQSLAQLVRKGVGFHHAGLGPASRRLVENSFKEGTVKLLAATPTLAAGVNLPARRVVIASVLRYDSDYGGNTPISILEYKQLCGRAGRPKYDDFGEAIIVTEQGGESGGTRASPEELYDHYVLGTPEPLQSQLSGDKALRFHLLSFIATMPGLRESDIYEFFSMTLLGTQKRGSVLEFKIAGTLEYLEYEGLILLRNGRYMASEFGKKISLLYIDPATGVEFKKSLERLPRSREGRNTLGFLHLISVCSDFYPKLGLRKKDQEALRLLLQQRQDELPYQVSEYDSSRSFLALAQWIEEASESHLSDHTGVEPGDMHRIIENAQWLAYSLYEIAKMGGREDLLPELGRLRTRLRYGVLDELIPLVALEGVGRVRARALYAAGYTDPGKIAKSSLAKISAVDKIGPSVAKKIKDQLMNKGRKE